MKLQKQLLTMQALISNPFQAVKRTPVLPQRCQRQRVWTLPRGAARTCTRCSGWRWRGTQRSRSCPPPAWHQLCEWSSEKQPRSELHLRNTAEGTEVTVTASSRQHWACVPGASSPAYWVHTWASTNAQGLRAILTVLHTYWGGGKNEMI